MGYKFGDIRSFHPCVQARDKAVVTSDRKVTVDSSDRYVLVKEFDREGRRQRNELIRNTTGHFDRNIVCPPGRWTVVQSEEEPELGIFERVWKTVKKDIGALRSISARIPVAGALDCPNFAVIVPDRPPADRDERNDLASFEFILKVAGVRCGVISAGNAAGRDLRNFDIIVPAGDHALHFEPQHKYFDMERLKTRLLDFSGELTWASFLNNGVDIRYVEEKGPCYAVISRRPVRVLVDGRNVSLCALSRGGRGYSVKLPGGTHEARIVTSEGAASLVESSGMVVLSLIVTFGFVTSMLFLALFLVIRVKRKWMP